MTDGENELPHDGKARTWNGRYVNIAHRRTPSELTPLIRQNLALQQQVELLTAQNQHMMHQQLAVGQPQSTQTANYSAPSQLLPAPPQIFHQRGWSHSSSHSSGGSSVHGRQRSVGSMGHVRRQSLAVSEAKRAAQERSGATTSNSNDGNGGSPTSNTTPFVQTTNADGKGSPGPLVEPVPQFRFPPSPDRPNNERAGRGHSRSQSTSSALRGQTPSPQRFQFPPSPVDVAGTTPSATIPNTGSELGHSRRTSNWRDDSSIPNAGSNGIYGHRSRPSNASDFSPGQQHAQGGRKSLFVPYLPQSAIPEMIAEGLLVTGTLRVNHKNRSYAYVTTDLLDADVFIDGSKDRNRALEGDIVAVELLDVDDVWEQKREKEERKRRRGGETSDSRLIETQEGQLRRRGSLRQRAPQKRSDDVEVEGQTLLLREDFATGEEKPLYSGHVVAILERPAGQLFSGTLSLLRPSSQANKERQQTDRQQQQSHSRHPSISGGYNSNANGITEEANSKPKIVWFKPVDKCVPLMAIPTEQVPADLIENPKAYADQIFVAQIKRWPITSLHPFGMLVEQLGPFGDPAVSQKAVLRDFNFGAHKFSDVALLDAKNAGFTMSEAAKTRSNSVATEVTLLGPDLAASIFERDGEEVVAIHVLDIVPFVERNGSFDREMRHKSAGVHMYNYESPLVDNQQALDSISFKLNRCSPAITVELAKDTGSTIVKLEAITPNSSNNTGKLENIASVLRRRRGVGSLDDNTLDLSSLLDVTVPARSPLSDPKRDEVVITELVHAANAAIASELLRSSAVGLNTLVRRQAEPPVAKLEQLANIMRSIDMRIDTTSAHTLARSLTERLEPRQITAVKASLAKIMSAQRYAVAARTNPGQLGHYWFGFDAYTHFARPLLRYADQVVARQIHTMLGTVPAFPDQFVSAAADLAPELSFRYNCAHGVQEQSFHLALTESLNSTWKLMDAVVTTVYESAFDVVIPEMSVEKRVHGDQLPVANAEFSSKTQTLTLTWIPGMDTAVYEPDSGDNTIQGSSSHKQLQQQQNKTPRLSEATLNKLKLQKDLFQQVVQPMLEIPVLVKVAADERVLPSIIVRAANPFA